MIKILASDGMEKAAVALLREKGYEVEEQFYAPEELGAKLAEVDVLVVRSATKVRKPIIDEAKKAGKLQLVIRGGVGVDNIDVAYAEENGIKVRNTPKASSDSVAELALGHMFALARYIAAANVTMKNGEWNKKKYEGIELAGKTLGLIGMGRISQSIARKATALGMNTLLPNVYTADQMSNVPDNEHVLFVLNDTVVSPDAEVTEGENGATVTVEKEGNNTALLYMLCFAAIIAATAGIIVFIMKKPAKKK